MVGEQYEMTNIYLVMEEIEKTRYQRLKQLMIANIVLLSVNISIMVLFTTILILL